MQQKAIISKDRYKNKLDISPLFFLRFHKNIVSDSKGNKRNMSWWEAVDSDLEIKIPDNKFGIKGINYCLCIIDSVQEDTINGRISIEITFRPVNGKLVSDWSMVLKNCLVKWNTRRDYSFLELLWMLRYTDDRLYTNAFTALNQYSEQQRFELITNIIGSIGRALSYNQQMSLKMLYSNIGMTYNCYYPQLIIDAYTALIDAYTDFESVWEDEYEDQTLFDLIDTIVKLDRKGLAISIDYQMIKNIFLEFRLWLNDSSYKFSNYAFLSSMFAMTDEETRLNIVKRYFHDVRNGNTKLDIGLIKQFKDNPYSSFIQYRHCLTKPSEKVDLTAQLLCDNIITLYNTKGKDFQTFDGVLDLAMTHCDTSNPGILFQMEYFLPLCENGAVYNENFNGFVDYSTVFIPNKSAFNEEYHSKFILQLLDKYARHKQYPVCRFSGEKKIPDETFAHCSKVLGNSNNKATLDCYVMRNYEDIWIISTQYSNIWNMFLRHLLEFTPNGNHKEYECSWKDVSVAKFGQSIETFFSIFSKTTVDNEIEVPSRYHEMIVASGYHDDVGILLLQTYFIAVKMRFYPQPQAIVGGKFDVFGFYRNLFLGLPVEKRGNGQIIENMKKQFVEQESKEVYRRTVESLTKELDSEIINGKYFELPYNYDRRNTIIRRYYFKKSYEEKEEMSKYEFLKEYKGKQEYFKLYCAPQLSEANNPAIDLPYFWCRGKECFRNSLGKQTLSTVDSWHSYTLFHICEIMGYPKIHETIAGYEPDKTIIFFISMVNKVVRKFKCLKCRSCGHMLFTCKTWDGFNRINFYQCINRTCPECGESVYLNFCYKCKKGLIDSRDTKQCPNDMYICKECLSCCDDLLYERMAQKHELIGHAVPLWIKEKRGRGHNDKGIFFCPDCGAQLDEFRNEHNTSSWECPHCKKVFGKKFVN